MGGLARKGFRIKRTYTSGIFKEVDYLTRQWPEIIGEGNTDSITPRRAASCDNYLIKCCIRNAGDAVAAVKGLPVGDKFQNCSGRICVCVGPKDCVRSRSSKERITGRSGWHPRGCWPEVGGECRPAIFIAEGKRETQCFTRINLGVQPVMYRILYLCRQEERCKLGDLIPGPDRSIH